MPVTPLVIKVRAEIRRRRVAFALAHVALRLRHLIGTRAAMWLACRAVGLIRLYAVVGDDGPRQRVSIPRINATILKEAS